MTRQLLAASLSAVLLAQGPAAYAAQAVVAPVSIPAGAMLSGAAAAGLRLTGFTPTLSPSLVSAPVLSVTPAAALPSVTPRATAVPVAAAIAAPAAVAVRPAAIPMSVRVVRQTGTDPQRDNAVRGGALAALTETTRRAASEHGAPAATGRAFNLLFDGCRLAGRDAEAVPAGSAAPRRSGLAPARAAVAPAAPAEPRAPRRLPKALGAAALTAGALLLIPSVALAAAPAAAGGVAVQMLATAQPLASLAAALAGALYGLLVTYKRDGPPPSPGEVLSAMLRYGLLAGAGVYVLGDLGRIVVVGFPAAGLTPLPSAVATAALGQGAFQGKFADPATTPADRLMAAFPAVAGALGLSVGVALAAPSLLYSLAVGAMSATGVAAAFYAAAFKPGVSPAGGPQAMARGYVLQALMTGLALAVTGPYLVWPFLALGAWGFAEVLWTALRAAWAALPVKG